MLIAKEIKIMIAFYLLYFLIGFWIYQVIYTNQTWVRQIILIYIINFLQFVPIIYFLTLFKKKIVHYHSLKVFVLAFAMHLLYYGKFMIYKIWSSYQPGFQPLDTLSYELNNAFRVIIFIVYIAAIAYMLKQKNLKTLRIGFIGISLPLMMALFIGAYGIDYRQGFVLVGTFKIFEGFLNFFKLIVRFDTYFPYYYLLYLLGIISMLTTIHQTKSFKLD